MIIIQVEGARGLTLMYPIAAGLWASLCSFLNCYAKSQMQDEAEVRYQPIPCVKNILHLHRLLWTQGPAGHDRLSKVCAGDIYTCPSSVTPVL